MIVAVAGYGTYGSLVQSDILLNYPRNGITTCARIFVALLVAFSYPLQNHPARRSVLSIVDLYYKKVPTEEEEAETVNVMLEGQIAKDNKGDINKDNKDNNKDKDTTVVVAAEEDGPPVIICGYDTGMSFDRFRYWVCTACFLTLSYVVALSVKSLGTVLAFVGATGSTMVSYILPGFCYYFIFTENSERHPAWKRYFALFQGCLGLIIVPLCLTFIFI